MLLNKGQLLRAFLLYAGLFSAASAGLVLLLFQSGLAPLVSAAIGIFLVVLGGEPRVAPRFGFGSGGRGGDDSRRRGYGTLAGQEFWHIRSALSAILRNRVARVERVSLSNV